MMGDGITLKPREVRVLAAMKDGVPRTVNELTKLTGLSKKRTLSALCTMQWGYVVPPAASKSASEAWELSVEGGVFVAAVRKYFGGKKDVQP